MLMKLGFHVFLELGGTCAVAVMDVGRVGDGVGMVSAAAGVGVGAGVVSVVVRMLVVGMAAAPRHVATVRRRRSVTIGVLLLSLKGVIGVHFADDGMVFGANVKL